MDALRTRLALVTALLLVALTGSSLLSELHRHHGGLLPAAALATFDSGHAAPVADDHVESGREVESQRCAACLLRLTSRLDLELASAAAGLEPGADLGPRRAPGARAAHGPLPAPRGPPAA